MSDILCTGSAGFIAQHTIRVLKAQGHAVVGLDRRRGEYVDFLLNICNYETMRQTLLRLRPEVVFHFAAFTSVRESMAAPTTYVENNIGGTLNVLRAVPADSLKKVVFISSGGTVYGVPKRLPVSVADAVNPEDFYGLTKLAGEHIVRIWCQQRGIGWYNLRYPNVYGPGQDPDGEAGVVAIFAKKMLNKGDPIINGTGTQTRDFMFITDVARETIRIAESFPSGTYNIGTGRETSVLEIYDALAGLTGYKGERKFGPAKVGEVARIALEPDYPPTSLIGLQDGLAATVEWMVESEHVSVEVEKP